jgi:hypothetical protein
MGRGSAFPGLPEMRFSARWKISGFLLCRASPGPAAIQIALNLLARSSKSRRATKDNRRDTGTVRLSGASNSKNWTSQDFHAWFPHYNS